MTTYRIDFNFENADQNKILGELQKKGYKLIGFKGADGPSLIGAGVPAWFAIPFGHVFGKDKIEYTPKYKVYIYFQSNIAAHTDIEMSALSGETELGKSLTFTSTGRFVPGGVDGVPDDSIGIRNQHADDVTVGLAGEITTHSGTVYAPFCAFDLPSGSTVVMKPLEQVLLVAARTDLQSGSVHANLSAPGCMFAFDDMNEDYPLKIEDGDGSTYALVSDGGPMVTRVDSGAAVAKVINASAND